MVGDVLVCPRMGTVAFGSCSRGWSFNGELHGDLCSEMGDDNEEVVKHLWGHSFFTAKEKTWASAVQPEGCVALLPRVLWVRRWVRHTAGGHALGEACDAGRVFVCVRVCV